MNNSQVVYDILGLSPDFHVGEGETRYMMVTYRIDKETGQDCIPFTSLGFTFFMLIGPIDLFEIALGKKPSI